MKVEKSVSITVENVILRTTSPLVLCGDLLPAGTLIEVSQDEAANIKSRNRAVDATEAEVAAGVKPVASGTIDNVANLAHRLREVSVNEAAKIKSRNHPIRLSQEEINAIIERSQRMQNEGRKA